jgi:hypothetical protein
MIGMEEYYSQVVNWVHKHSTILFGALTGSGTCFMEIIDSAFELYSLKSLTHVVVNTLVALLGKIGYDYYKELKNKKSEKSPDKKD